MSEDLIKAIQSLSNLSIKNCENVNLHFHLPESFMKPIVETSISDIQECSEDHSSKSPTNQLEENFEEDQNYDLPNQILPPVPKRTKRQWTPDITQEKIDEDKMEIPENIRPYNMPWKEVKKVNVVNTPSYLEYE